MFDGSGGAAGTDNIGVAAGSPTRTRSYSANVVKREYLASYTVNSDCTGTLSLATIPVMGFDFVLVSQGKSLLLVESDEGASVTGNAYQQ